MNGDDFKYLTEEEIKMKLQEEKDNLIRRMKKALGKLDKYDFEELSRGEITVPRIMEEIQKILMKYKGGEEL
jgi:hypothetical protein